MSIVDDLNSEDGSVILYCLASDGVPDNYSYEWEHRTYANDHIRFLSSKPDIIIENDTRSNNGVYICRVCSSFGQKQQSEFQIAVYNLSLPGDTFSSIFSVIFHLLSAMNHNYGSYKFNTLIFFWFR